MLNEKEKRERIYGKEISTEEALERIHRTKSTGLVFDGFNKEEKAAFLDFIRGKKGLRILYDSYFRRIMDPQKDKTRLEDFLSSLLHQKVSIKGILDREGSRISSDGSFVIMDIIVEFFDGSLADIEAQKVGYDFPGERADCYCADMIMRQYDAVRKRVDARAVYRSMKPVYLFVMIEDSPKELLNAAPAYIHRKSVSYDSGAQISNLDRVMLISLDIFRQTVHDISDRESAWLTFFSCDDIDRINELVDKYPDFLELYEEIYAFRERPEEVISMFSEALRIMDHNTELYMIDKAKKELAETTKKLDVAKGELDATKGELDVAKGQLDEANRKLEEKDRIIAELQKALSDK